MQANQVDFEQTYALTLKGKLVRFKPAAVITVTRRTASEAKPRATNYVEGLIPASDLPSEMLPLPDGQETLTHQIEVSLIGEPFEAALLRTRQEADKRAREAKEQQENRQACQLGELLYRLSGLAKGGDMWHRPFDYQTNSRNGDVTVRPAGVAWLLELLQNHEKTPNQKDQSAG